jgi:hypothetical protein
VEGSGCFRSMSFGCPRHKSIEGDLRCWCFVLSGGLKDEYEYSIDRNLADYQALTRLILVCSGLFRALFRQENSRRGGPAGILLEGGQTW